MANQGGDSGSHPSGHAASGVDGASRIDRGELASFVAARLGKAQQRVILSLTDDWGKAACHQAARRMFYGVTKDRHTVIFHKHRTDNCWCLSDLGVEVKAILQGANQ